MCYNTRVERLFRKIFGVNMEIGRETILTAMRWYGVRWQTDDAALAEVLGRLTEHRQKNLEAAKERADDLRLLFGRALRVKVLSESIVGNYEIKQRPFVGENRGRGFAVETEDSSLLDVLRTYELGVAGKSGWRKRQATERVFGKAAKTAALVEKQEMNGG